MALPERRKIVKFVSIFMILTVTSLVAREMMKSTYSGSPQKSAEEGPSPFMTADAAIGTKLDGKFVFTDQSGEEFDIGQWFDKPLIVSYVFTNCPYVCPTISASLSSFVQKSALKLGEDYRIVSIGFDHENDTPTAMKSFGENFIEDFSSWRFLSGTPEALKAFSNKLGIIYGKDDEGAWRHTVAVTVVGSGGVVSSQALGMDYSLEQLEKPLKMAMAARTP